MSPHRNRQTGNEYYVLEVKPGSFVSSRIYCLCKRKGLVTCEFVDKNVPIHAKYTLTPFGALGSFGSQSHSSSHSFVLGSILPGFPSLMQHGTFPGVEKHSLQLFKFTQCKNRPLIQ